MANWDHYYRATARMHEAVDRLYESLHDDAGNPILEEYLVHDLVARFRSLIWIETDLIQEISIDDPVKKDNERAEEPHEGD